MAMSDASDHWRRVEALCQAALEHPVAERDAFLRGACSDDHLRHEVETLLGRESAAEHFLETPVGAAVASVMPTAPLQGRRIGAFEVGPLLGAGAMGDVYRARDVDLNRDVALKILPQPFALDPDRLARFKREAQVLASLNHPNIAAIHGFEASDEVQALVLELVEGPTLADRIAQGPIPLVEALPDRATDRRRPGSGSRTRDCSSRFEAGQRQAAARQHGEGAGLRPCEGAAAAGHDRRKPDGVTHDHGPVHGAGRRDPRDRRVHEPRAGQGTSGRQAERRLGIRRGSLRNAVGSDGIRGHRCVRHALGGRRTSPGQPFPPRRLHQCGI